MAQIKSASLPEQQVALTQLLTSIKCKIRSLRKAEKARKRRWLIKRARNEFHVNPYKAGKNQETLDQHKSSNLVDKSYDIPLGNLEDLPPEPSLLKKFNKSSFSYNDFLEILLTRRNASAPGLNGIPCKVYKKCSEISKFLFKIFQACFKDVKFPFNGEVLKRYIYPKLAILLRTKSQIFTQ